MNFVRTTTYERTTKDADELYKIFKDEIAKCTCHLKSLIYLMVK